MREEVRRAFDALTDAPHPALRSALRARLEADEPYAEERPRFWRMTIAATLVAGLVVVALVGSVNLLNRNGNPVPGPAVAVSPSPSTVPSPSPLPSTTPVIVATAVPACQSVTGGASGMADVTDVRVGPAAGYDRFVIQFNGPVPSYTISYQDSAGFMQDASGQVLQLQGSTAIKVVVRGASGTDVNGHQTFTGSQDLKPGFPVLKEARQVGDFERTFTWGLGLSQVACAKTTVLTGPDRLVVDVVHP